MALGLAEALADKLVAGVISAPELLDTQGWQSFVGGHPLPNEASLEAAQAAFQLLDRANSEQALVIFLISGGGSAICEWPISDDISLADLRRANHVLVTCGARIAEVNAVRRAFSAVKGGALARRASRAQILTLIVSDTNRGDEASVASGPSLPPPADAPNAIDVVEGYRLEPLLPGAILKAVQRARPCNSTSAGSHFALLDNWTAIEAACHKALEFGLTYATAAEIGELPIANGCELVLSPLLSDETDQSFCLISGNEFSCPVRGDGRGGRNIETVLRCAILLDKTARQDRRHSVILSAGTTESMVTVPLPGRSQTKQRSNVLAISAWTLTIFSHAAIHILSSNNSAISLPPAQLEPTFAICRSCLAPLTTNNDHSGICGERSSKGSAQRLLGIVGVQPGLSGS